MYFGEIELAKKSFTNALLICNNENLRKELEEDIDCTKKLIQKIDEHNDELDNTEKAESKVPKVTRMVAL